MLLLLRVHLDGEINRRRSVSCKIQISMGDLHDHHLRYSAWQSRDRNFPAAHLAHLRIFSSHPAAAFQSLVSCHPSPLLFSSPSLADQDGKMQGG